MVDVKTIPDKSQGFPARGAWVIRALMEEFSLTENQAAGIVGNIGFESAGFTKLHEIGQPEGRGGYGWAQWTGPRREAFFEWCNANNLDWSSDEANYGYLVEELKTSQAATIANVRKTTSLEAAVFTVGFYFERPGGTTTTYLPGFPERQAYARRALAAMQPPQAADAPSGLTKPLPPIELLSRQFATQARSLQSALLTAGFYKGQVDGDWGPMSRDALKAWQDQQKG